MIQRLVSIFLFLMFLPIVAQAGGEAPREDEVLDQSGAPAGGDFTLNSAAGPVSTSDLRGKVILLYFGYTKCPDVCPTSLSMATQALNELSGKELKSLTSIFVSVDPQRDTVEQLKEYVEYFHESFIGVTGSEEKVAEVAKMYGAQYYQVELEGSAFGYSVNHSAATYLIAPDGQLRFIFPHETPPQVMLEGIRYLMAGN
ncbi:MAG: SCO family protein [gamma proteobacterium endosymbiont of Lamellibrachia anaximandri]|nr:SCO family protein [gamma proteobacterium endosymbiont of Lamellibrachia anaximandri]MBL3533548.1 SCO family protein [gamma proteobacterium endosymbiont of Lamellibrachia anaximandri]